jgi:uncharacterized delta-60 repeat protein
VAANHFLARYNTDGTLDTTFSEDGIQTTSFGHWYAPSIAIQSDGRIVFAGQSYNEEYETNFVLARYNTDGTLDSTFQKMEYKSLI